MLDAGQRPQAGRGRVTERLQVVSWPMLGATGRINLVGGSRIRRHAPEITAKRRFAMADILNLALPYFGLIFIGFACGKTRGLPEAGLAWMNFFLLYVSLPALLFGIMSKTPFAELNNPPFLIATTLGDGRRFRAGHGGGPVHRELSCAKRRWRALPAPTAISAIWAPAWRWRCSAPRRRRRPR